jgi:hypothetical protein
MSEKINEKESNSLGSQSESGMVGACYETEDEAHF